MQRSKPCGARRRFVKGALGAAAAAWWPAWADNENNPFALPPLTYPSLDLKGPGGLTARDILNRGYWPVPCLPPASGAIETTEIAENVYVLTGSGCNVVAVTTGRGTLLIDGGREEHSEALLAAVAELPNGGPVHTLFNTSWRPEYRGSNRAVAAAGGRIVAHRLAADWQSVRVVHPWDPEHPHPPLPKEARPNDTFQGFDSTPRDAELGGVRVSYALLPFAHTDSSLYVYLPDANVVAIGGVTNGPASSWATIPYRGNWPEIDWWTGGRGNQIAPALRTVIERTNADTIVVPAQGGLLRIDDLDRQARMFETIMSGTGTDAIDNVYHSGAYGRDEVLARFLANEARRAYIDEWGDPTVFVYRSIESSWPTMSTNG